MGRGWRGGVVKRWHEGCIWCVVGTLPVISSIEALACWVIEGQRSIASDTGTLPAAT